MELKITRTVNDPSIVCRLKSHDWQPAVNENSFRQVQQREGVDFRYCSVRCVGVIRISYLFEDEEGMKFGVREFVWYNFIW